MVAEGGIEPPTEAYETPEIPFLYSATAIYRLLSVGHHIHWPHYPQITPGAVMSIATPRVRE